MSDITKHKWSTGGPEGTIENFDYGGVDGVAIHSNYIYLHSGNAFEGVSINKDDSVAIAKHFYSQLPKTIKDRQNFIDLISDITDIECKCNYHLGMGPNLKCPVHGEENKIILGQIPQSETTKHHLGAIGNIKRHD